jgi:hypothetical protein
MKVQNVAVFFYFGLFLFSCGEHKSNDNSSSSSDSGKIGLSVDSSINKQVQGNIYDSLYTSVECDDNKIELRTKQLENEIDSLLSYLQSDLQKSNKDTLLTNPIVELLQTEKKNYKSNIETSADLIFWSYGVASMTGERVVARKCFYLRELQKKKVFYLSIADKVRGSLINL